ncbi:MAG: homoserine dehydrogenase [Planctomycetaceae bacterium]|nr:homoserine dehydrogenase [Planctomycetaceae bacterium]MCP4480612.1 homoserine dehydrogenase [Planctomycetaceae bacterium]
MNKTGVAIVGLGTVGQGVAQLLLDHGDRTARHAGRTLWLSHVVVQDIHKPRDVDLPAGILTDDLDKVINDDSVKVVAQLVGGIEPARSIILKLLESGKDVVTANKALLAEHGPEIFDRARQLGRSVAFEASAAGGIPIITNVSQCLSANQIESLHAILNGTSNFILSKMDSEGGDYQTALALAQQQGLAEADPAMDVDGTDAAQKLAILAHLCFGARVHWSDIPRRGIDSIDDRDLTFSKHLGYRIKLIAFAKLAGDGIQLMVSPMLVKTGKPLAEVQANFNAVSVVGDAVGPVFFHGQGAGQMPTASAVVADMIDTAVGRTAITFKTLELWADGHKRVDFAEPGDLEGRYYMRFDVVDQPGVMGQITGRLGQHGISIASVYQHETQNERERTVPIVIMTHAAKESSARAAMKQIADMPTVAESPERFRILS